MDNEKPLRRTWLEKLLSQVKSNYVELLTVWHKFHAFLVQDDDQQKWDCSCRGSNPRHLLGREVCYHYTTAAVMKKCVLLDYLSQSYYQMRLSYEWFLRHSRINSGINEEEPWWVSRCKSTQFFNAIIVIERFCAVVHLIHRHHANECKRLIEPFMDEPQFSRLVAPQRIYRL